MADETLERVKELEATVERQTNTISRLISTLWEEATITAAEHDALRRTLLAPSGELVAGDGRLIARREEKP